MVHHAEQEYGQMDPMTFDYKIRLATISRKVDGDQDALSMLEPLYECYSQLPRTNDERMARLLGKMTSVHQSLGHIEQAVFYAEKRFELWELDSPNSREWSSALSSLCDLYINNGQAEKAVTLLEDIFSLYYKTSSPNVEWVEILISLAEAHIELKRHSEAIPHVTEAFSQLAKLLSDDIEPSSLICLMSRLAKIYTDLDELSVAITVFEMRVNLESSDPSLDESERLLTLRELAEGYLELGDREKLKPAVELLEEVIEGQEILDTDVEELECTEKLLSYARWKLTRATRTQQSVASNIDQQSSQEEAATKLPASTLSEDETVTQQASYSCTDVAQAPRRNPSRKKRKHETMLEQATELDGSIVSGELEPKPRRSQRIKRRKTSDTQPRS
jgi:tetratricopeptide (TPR) repeat protein